MNIQDLIKDAKNLSSHDLERKLNELVRENHKYRNLNSDNREIVMDLINKYKTKIRRGVGVSSFIIRKDMYNLNRKRLKMDLTEEDLDDIRDILNEFKK
jgi:low affinity Fe/Cu permease